MEPSGLNPHMFHQVVKQSKFTACMIITFQVMAFTRMSAGYPYAVRPLPQGSQGKFRAHPSGTGYSYYPDIRRILHSAHTCQICCTVTAPVAQKTDNFRFPIRHFKISFFLMPGNQWPGVKYIFSKRYIASRSAKICEKIWSLSKPCRCNAPDLQEATQRPQPLQSTGLI